MKKETTEVTLVQIPGHGGFPVDNLAYWKTDTRHVSQGVDETFVHVQFKTGGFINLPPEITEQEFAAFVFGVPF